MSGKAFSGKIRRHTYSLAELRAGADARANRRPHERASNDDLGLD